MRDIVFEFFGKTTYISKPRVWTILCRFPDFTLGQVYGLGFFSVDVFQIIRGLPAPELMFNSGTLTSKRGGLGGSSLLRAAPKCPTVSIGLEALLGCFRLGP